MKTSKEVLYPIKILLLGFVNSSGNSLWVYGDSFSFENPVPQVHCASHAVFVSHIKPVRMKSPSVCPSSELCGASEGALSVENEISTHSHPYCFSSPMVANSLATQIKPKCNDNLLIMSKPVLPSSKREPTLDL